MLNIVYLDTIDSTNNWCQSHADKLPVAVVAAEQTAGRGRYGRSFYSPAGGAYMSYAFRANYADDDVQFTTLATAAIVHQVLQSYCDDELSIKWVNDIYLGSRKIAGILCERVDDADGYYIVIGVGVNVTPCDTPDELKDIVGYLCDDSSLDPVQLAGELATALNEVFAEHSSDISDLGEYIDYYKAHCHNLPDNIDI